MRLRKLGERIYEQAREKAEKLFVKLLAEALQERYPNSKPNDWVVLATSNPKDISEIGDPSPLELASLKFDQQNTVVFRQMSVPSTYEDQIEVQARLDWSRINTPQRERGDQWPHPAVLKWAKRAADYKNELANVEVKHRAKREEKVKSRGDRKKAKDAQRIAVAAQAAEKVAEKLRQDVVQLSVGVEYRRKWFLGKQSGGNFQRTTSKRKKKVPEIKTRYLLAELFSNNLKRVLLIVLILPTVYLALRWAYRKAVLAAIVLLINNDLRHTSNTLARLLTKTSPHEHAHDIATQLREDVRFQDSLLHPALAGLLRRPDTETLRQILVVTTETVAEGLLIEMHDPHAARLASRAWEWLFKYEDIKLSEEMEKSLSGTYWYTLKPTLKALNAGMRSWNEEGVKAQLVHYSAPDVGLMKIAEMCVNATLRLPEGDELMKARTGFRVSQLFFPDGHGPGPGNKCNQALQQKGYKECIRLHSPKTDRATIVLFSEPEKDCTRASWLRSCMLFSPRVLASKSAREFDLDLVNVEPELLRQTSPWLW